MLPLQKRNQLNYWSIALALVFWGVMFRPGVQATFNFWFMMPIATVALASLGLIVNYPLIKKEELNARNIVTGIVSAILLYGIFWVGNSFMNIVAHQFPDLVGNKTAQLQSVYTQGNTIPRYVIGMMLFFPIGMCEELYWRGMVQQIMNEKYGRKRAVIFTVFFYTIVHLSTGNVMLILAAFTCGLFWALLYYYTKSIVPGVISHMLWDPLIFAIFPIL